MNWTLLHKSLLVGSMATVLAVGIGFVAALWLAGLEARWQTLFLAAAAIALVLPPFLVTGCWLHFLGYTGVWRGWLPLNLYSLGGTVWILALLLWPITLFLTLGSWRRLEPSQLESDPALNGGSLVRWLLWPQARAALEQATAVTFVLALNNFAVPAILQTKVFPAEVWVRFNTTFDYRGALQMSLPLVAAPMLVMFYFRRAAVSWPQTEGAVSPNLFRRHIGARWFQTSGVVTLLVILASVCLPLFQIVAIQRTWTELTPAFAAGTRAVANSVLYAALAATLCVALGFSAWRWRWGMIFWLPFLVPGVLLGLALIFIFNRPWFSAFYQSAGIVVVAFGVRYLGFGWSTASLARRSVDRDLIDAAVLGGATRWQLIRDVHWPQMAPLLAGAWYVVYLLCLWDVETLILIVPPGGETLALRVFNLLHYGHNTHVNALCLVLLLLAVAPLCVAAALVSARAALISARTPHKGYAVLANAAALLAALSLSGCAQSPPSEAPVDSRIFSTVQVLGSRGTGLGEFNKPRSVAIDAQDNLYVADMTGRVQKFSAQGKFLSSWQMPQTDQGKPKGMCCDQAGNIVVVEPHYSRVNHFSPGGQSVAQWGQIGTNAGQLFFPRAVAVNSRGEIWVSEYGVVERVQRFTALGREFLSGFGRPGTGAGELNRAEGLGIDAQDRIYVADSCNHRVQVFSRAGQFLRAYGSPGSGRGQFSYPYDVRVDAAGRQYVCEFGNSRVQIFDGQDRLIEVLGGVGSAPGQFNNPWSLALDSRGNLYVADSGNHRVQKFIRKTPLSVVCRQSRMFVLFSPVEGEKIKMKGYCN
jgi:ABC-type Fe3+ transport system permease subunit/DNA-binding beta-propeller fold protein YncE